MELDVQDWLIVIGALLIVGVLLDAYRRYRSHRRNPIRMRRLNLGPGDGFHPQESDPAAAELPSGRARVVHRDAEVSPPAEVMRRPSERVEPAIDPQVAADAPDLAGAPMSAEAPTGRLLGRRKRAASREPLPPATPEPPPLPELQLQPQPQPSTPPLVPTPAAAESAEAAEVIVIRVVARGEAGFLGPDLLRVFRECDVRLGPRRVFQRTEQARGEGPVQFSVINAGEQGTFQNAELDGFSTRGLGFFMRLPGPQRPLEAFDCMLETARAVARYCDGELRDDSNSAFTQQTGEHCRERISEFALRARVRG
jgi:cell division protein ZipA